MLPPISCPNTYQVVWLIASHAALLLLGLVIGRWFVDREEDG